MTTTAIPGTRNDVVRGEAAVAAHFDAQHARFKTEVAGDDSRAQAILGALGPLDGRLVLDLGCGKGRFARVLAAQGARVVGLDLSAAMLGEADGSSLQRVQGSARRLPFASATFDAAVAVEVFEHVEPAALDASFAEAARVLRPGGILVIVDKNVLAMNAQRPWLPAAAVKWLDERRGLWMYPANGPVREHWFRPGEIRRRLHPWFSEVRMEHPVSRDETGRFPFNAVPLSRLFVVWAARTPGGAG